MRKGFSKKSPAWISKGRDYAREMVRIRDGRKCTMCKKAWNRKKRRLHVHHLSGMCGKNSRGYDSVKNIDGMTTLCPSCHRSVHEKKKYGRVILRGKKEKIDLMRWEGKSYDSIGKHFGVSSQAVYFFVNGRK